jgi:hypothetical protein
MKKVTRCQTVLTTALADVTAARINHPAAAGIDNIKTTTVIGHGAIAATLLTFAVRFADVGCFIGHGNLLRGNGTPRTRCES